MTARWRARSVQAPDGRPLAGGDSPDGAITTLTGRRHQETHTTATGQAVALTCRCRLGRDHTYTEWLRLPENGQHLADAQAVWRRMSQ